jgi:hypothetical protein
MTDNDKPLHKHKRSAKEHLAGIKAAAAWQQDLQAAQLLRTQAPIRDTPVEPPAPASSP